eukprot:8501365-Lingulodinium_polyedra.AAC.1
MMRPSRPSAAATAYKSHARALHANARSHGTRARARVRLANRCGGRRSTRPHHCARLLKHAVDSTVCRHNGSPIAGARTPCEH